METEVFRDIEGYEGLYQVSNLGNIKSLKYGKERILKPNKDRGGYLYVILCKNGNKKTYLVHRLVALAFLLNPENLKEINHKDENSLNNSLENLEWCDRKYNNSYGTKNDRMISTRTKKNSVNAEKTVLQLSKDGIKLNTYKSIREAERQTDINQASIGKCCKGNYKSAGGYIWKYAI